MIPRFNEGGAFVKYSHKPELTEAEVVDAVKRTLEEHRITPWFNPFQVVRVGRVRGRPWIEDLRRIPSPQLRVEFLPAAPGETAVEPTPETLYSFFRKYGRLRDIRSAPPGSKSPHSYAIIEFARPKYAVMAKNCLHGYVLPAKDGKAGTRLKLTYERIIKASSFKDWSVNHPRVVFPLLAALIAGITVAVFDPIRTFFMFDPIRTFFIELKLKTSFPTEKYPVLQWIRDFASSATILGRRRKAGQGLAAVWEDRSEDNALLQSWLTENIDAFIVVSGPRGSGKKEFVVDQALKNCKYKLVIDCKRIQDAKGDAAKISVAASQVGYIPVFSWMQSISSALDLAMQGLIGTKVGLSEALDTQLGKIWQNTSVALKKIALEGRSKDDKDAYLNDEDYLEAHPEKRPVLVIDNFLHNAVENNVIYDKIGEWAGELITGNVAHVIFLTVDTSYPKVLSKALPNQVFRNISLGDCSLETGRRFVLSHVQAEEEQPADGTEQKSPKNLEGLDECIKVLGGRVTDLEIMTHRIQAGDTPKGTFHAQTSSVPSTPFSEKRTRG